MANVTLPVVDINSGKKEEIVVLNKMAEAAGRGSYLASLFTPEMVEWASNLITDEACPDLYAWFSAAEAEKRVLENQLADAKAANEVLNNQVIQQMEQHVAQVARKDKAFEELTKYKEALIADAGNLSDSLEQAEHEIDHLQKLVVALKVEVYDLTHQ